MGWFDGNPKRENKFISMLIGQAAKSVEAIRYLVHTLEQVNLDTIKAVHTLAEPTLTAISGESATFISGGEFPIPTGVTCQTTTQGAIGQCVQTVSFKKFGISLNFTPVVLSEGRISLRVMTEVSELSNQHSITVSQAVSSTSTNSITIPSIQTRRAETTL